MNVRVADFPIARGIQALLFLFPVLLLSVRNGVSVCLVILTLASMYSLVARDLRTIHFDRADLVFVVAMASPLLSSLVIMVVLGDFALHALDGPSRFLLAVPTYLAVRHTDLSISRSFEYAFPLGVIAGLITSLVFPSRHWAMQGTYFVDPANFAAAMLVLGCLCLASVDWTGRDHPALRLLKLVGFAVGVACAIRSTQRGVWIAIPVLLFLALRNQLSWRHRIAILAASAFISVGAYLAIPDVQLRVSDTRSEILKIVTGNLSSSAGERLQMWRAAASIILDNPIFGVGPSRVAEELSAYGGWSTPGALAYAISQIHNEILGHTLRGGIFGLASILAVYIVPLALAWQSASKNRYRDICVTMVMLVVVGYATVGLTIEVFNIKMFATFYALMVAVLLGASRQGSPIQKAV